METYVQMKKRHQKEFEALPTFVAFSETQFQEGISKIGASDRNEILCLCSGIYCKKSDKHLFEEYFRRTKQELIDAEKDFDFCVEMFKYELGNHEYIITYDPEDAIYACGLSMEKVFEDPHFSKAFKTAKEQYLKECEKLS